MKTYLLLTFATVLAVGENLALAETLQVPEGGRDDGPTTYPLEAHRPSMWCHWPHRVHLQFLHRHPAD